MKRLGGHRGFLAAALAVAIAAPSLDTAWTSRTSSHVSLVDPSLRAGEVALVHTTAGHAGALSLRLQQLGASDVQTTASVDMVIARLSAAALNSLANDADALLVTTDTRVVMTGDGDLDTIGNPSPADSVGLPAIDGPRAWKDSTGRGVTVVVMDSGIAEHPDLAGKVLTRVDFVKDGSALLDPAGHGTHIAGLIAANGEMKGVAPDARLISLRVLDANGDGKLSNVVKAFDWLLDHRKHANVEVVNISFGAPQATTYHKDLLSALVESAWFSGITVVVAAGNSGAGTHTVTTPATDPFVISVGSFDDQGTVATNDDVESTFSSRGLTLDSFAKPDVLAPGRHVVSLRAPGAAVADQKRIRHARTHADEVGEYIRMSGTSASAGFVSGVAALIVADHHSYSPTQVKAAILAGARAMGASAPALNAANAIDARGTANVGLHPSKLLINVLLSQGVRLKGITWEGITWEGITWESVTWEQIKWQAVSWETVSWESITWETVSWEGVVWEKVTAK